MNLVRVLPLLPLLGWTALSACSINFNEAIPCDDGTQCPGSRVCDTRVGRCAQGDGAAVDATDDLTDTVDRPDIADDALDAGDGSGDASDTSDVLVDALDGDDVPDTVEPDAADADTADALPDTAGDTPDPTDTDPDADPDTCVPVAEICDGLDNDCDGVPDDEIDCTSPCGPGATQLTGPSGAFCVDLYEASRRDATEVSAGADNSTAISRPGVLPWGFAPFAVAEAACTAAGKRLCTPEEWQLACAGPDTWAYPYNRSIYAGTTCNGLNVAPRDASVVTGQFSLCTNPATGTFDMSGNLSEWASDQGAHGGDFSDGQSFLRCNGVNRDISVEVAEPGVGFRCCATPAL